MAQVFLTNQTTATYKLLSTLAGQEAVPKYVNELTVVEVAAYMENQFDPKRFVVRERFKFWSDMERKPGETIQELASRIRQDAAKCDFASITDPQDDAMTTRFMCSVGNEAVLKALFKVRSDELTFAVATQKAQETEDAAQVAKETVHGSKEPVFKIQKGKAEGTKPKRAKSALPDAKYTCYRCGQTGHQASGCRHKDTVCRACNKKGHLSKVCRSKPVGKEKVGSIRRKPKRTVK